VQARARQAAEEAAAQRRRNEAALQASEEQARERAERLEQLAAQLRESDRRKDEFLAVLAHELRNPLAPVRSALEVLERVPEGPKAQRAREIARRQVAQMVRLIDDLLDVSRISRGKIVLRREPVRLAEVVDGAIEASRPLIASRGHHLAVEPADPALVLDIDAARVSQVLTNLLNNAATYTPPGGEIRLAVTATEHEVRIAVRDNGMGIPAEKLQHVFEMFAQAQPSPAGGGLGIGLSLASRLAELHGGRIEARSDGEGRGSEFVLVLPRGVPGLPSPAPPLQ
jgi:signal transduction histidine kinase